VRNKKCIGGLGLAVCLCLVVLLAGTPTAEANEAGYEYYVAGNPGDVTTATTPGLLLVGGSTDQDDAMRWMIGRSGGGDFVIIRASGTDAYNPYIYSDLGGVDSCETIIIQKRGASYDPFVLGKVQAAEALFIAGGNQWDYVRLWQGTPLEDAIEGVAARGAPVGGTSAGLAILGEFAFSAQQGTIISSQALKNPFHSHLTLTNDFLHLPYMSGVITDSHFAARNRMGRLVTFLARIIEDGWAEQARGIGIDEKTALAVSGDGDATVFGQGAVYFLETHGAPAVCQKNTPLTFENVSVYRISRDEGRFDLALWRGHGGTAYSLSAVEGVLSSTQPGGGIY
jgi:cyanophycinase